MHCSSLFDNAQLTCLAAKHGASQQPSRLPSSHFLPPETWSLSTLVKWVASILLVSLATISLSFAEDAGNLYNTPFDINAGASYFEKQCSRCHGFDARGNDEVGAPNLTGTLKRASSSAGNLHPARTDSAKRRRYWSWPSNPQGTKPSGANAHMRNPPKTTHDLAAGRNFIWGTHMQFNIV